MNRAVVVRANGKGGAHALTVDHEGRFCSGARHYGFGIGICVVDFYLAEVSAPDGSGALLLGDSVVVLDLYKLGTGGNLAVDVGVYLRMKARGVKALVALHVGRQRSVETAAPRAGDASSGGWVQGSVFLVEWSIGKGKVEVGLYPRAKVLCG